MCIGMANGGKTMAPQKALNRLDETVTGNLEWKIVLSNALEKQIPKKPKERQGTTYSFCPCCDSNNIYEYCGDCGQRIDWSDTDVRNER
jgi:hypothetical protein